MPPALQPCTRLALFLTLSLGPILNPTNLLAQAAPSHPAADSAAVARERYREAVGLLRAGNLGLAVRTAQLATSAWPSQPAYLGLVAQLAARLKDTALVARTLSRLGELGATYPVERDSALVGLREAAPVRAALDQMATATALLPASSPAATIGPADFWAEGLAVVGDGSILIGSPHHRRILRWYPSGQVVDLLPDADSLWGVSAIALDPDGRTLWATSNAIPQMAGYDTALAGRAELVRVGLDGSGVRSRHPVGSAGGGAMVGDILVTPEGTVFASDTRGQAIWRLIPGAATPTIVARHPLIRSPQGLVLAAGQAQLLVADYSHGLLRVDPATGSVHHLPVPAGTTLLGIDGIARHGRDLVAIQNGGVAPRVIRVRLDAAERVVLGIEVLDRNLTVADEPTLGVVVGDAFYYVANSQWEKRREDGSPLSGATLAPTVVLRLPLKALSP